MQAHEKQIVTLLKKPKLAAQFYIFHKLSIRQTHKSSRKWVKTTSMCLHLIPSLRPALPNTRYFSSSVVRKYSILIAVTSEGSH